jgi:hypothetical protein
MSFPALEVDADAPGDKTDAGGCVDVGEETSGTAVEPGARRSSPSVMPSALLSTPSPGYFLPLLVLGGSSLVGVEPPDEAIEVLSVDPRRLGRPELESRSLSDRWDDSEFDEKSDDSLLRPL